MTELGLLCPGARSEGGDKCGKGEQGGKEQLTACSSVFPAGGMVLAAGNKERPFSFGTRLVLAIAEAPQQRGSVNVVFSLHACISHQCASQMAAVVRVASALAQEAAVTQKPSAAATPTSIRRGFCRSETRSCVRQASNSFTLQPHPSNATSVSPYGWKLGLRLPKSLLGNVLGFLSIL